MRHDDPKHLFENICKKVFRDVEDEPKLQALTGEKLNKYKSANKDQNARSDVRVRSFWTSQQNAFFDFKVVYPFASSYLDKNPAALYEACAQDKVRQYEERINRVEASSFTPMIMSSTGGMGPQMSLAIKHIARCTAEKRKEAYSQTITVIRCRFTFALLRAALVCLRGSRSPTPRFFNTHDVLNTPVDLVAQETRL